jgi:hypothetical protein
MSNTPSDIILKLLEDIFDQAAVAPPPKQAGLDGRKGLARRAILSIIDDVIRLDTNLEGADWAPDDVARLKEKAQLALIALNEVT